MMKRFIKMRRKTERQYLQIENRIKDFWWEQFRMIDFRKNPNGLILGFDTSWDYQKKFASNFPRELVLMAMNEAGKDIVKKTNGEIYPHYDMHRKTWRFFRLVEVFDDDLMLTHQNATLEGGHRATSIEDYDLIKGIHKDRLKEEIKIISVKTPSVENVKRVEEVINSIRKEKI